ncbi:hypothetical protein [Floridanema evergladense]|uniref:Uncharacterized protein n=1 Tax=Floridaenema evergladense BLCC-F167 TaxID=3153639 RepID=A0ABV4WD09_9CYAN
MKIEIGLRTNNGIKTISYEGTEDFCKLVERAYRSENLAESIIIGDKQWINPGLSEFLTESTYKEVQQINYILTGCYSTPEQILRLESFLSKSVQNAEAVA